MIYHGVRITKRVLNRAGWVMCLMVVIHVIVGLLFSMIEDKSLMDGQWWASVTGFTVGYGDLFPVTTTGRVLAMIYMPISGLLWLVLGAHIVGAVLEEKHLFSNEEQEKSEAALLALLKERKLVPEDATELPSLEWFEQNLGFRADK